MMIAYESEGQGFESLRARHKNQLSACHWVGFFIFSAASSSNHASPSEARVLGKGRRRKSTTFHPFTSNFLSIPPVKRREYNGIVVFSSF